MKTKFLCVFLLLFVLVSCGGESEVTTVPETTESVTPSEPIIYRIFMSDTYIVVEGADGGFAAYHTKTPEDMASYTRIECAVPSDLEYDTATPVCAENGGGSGECEFLIELKNGEDTTYIAFDNFSYTNGDDWLEFEYRGIVSQEDFELYYK